MPELIHPANQIRRVLRAPPRRLPARRTRARASAALPATRTAPAARQGTVGSNSQNMSVQEQDPANVKGLPGNKSGPPAKR